MLITADEYKNMGFTAQDDTQLENCLKRAEYIIAGITEGRAEAAVERAVAVFVIPENRVANVRKMRANLMRAPGDKLHLQPGLLARLQHPVSGDDLLRAARGIVRHSNACDFRVLAQIGPHDGLALPRAALDPAGVELLKGAL